jgi:thioredoxin 1
MKTNFEDKGIFFVDFWAEWCGPCRMAAPAIEEIAKEYAGKITVVKVNVDHEQALAQKHGVMSIPTVILFKDGKEVGRQVGFAGKQGYLDLLKKCTM